MPTANGSLTPPRHPQLSESSSGTKRKRDIQDQGHRAVESATPPTPNEHDALAHALNDVFAVISSHDAAPAILNYPIDDTLVSRSTKPPPSKKAKTSGDDEPATISRKVAEASYTNLHALEEDVISICAAQISSLKDASGDEDKGTKRLSIDDVVQIQDIMSFELFVRDLISREASQAGSAALAIGDGTLPKSKRVKVEAGPTTESPSVGRSVLSLFGNAPNARQLFSSLQEDSELDMTLEELGLPSSLTASQLLPLPIEATTAVSASFRDTFDAPASLPQLQPPSKRSRQSRGGAISFVSPEKHFSKMNRKGSYTVQPLYAGTWLRYGARAAIQRNQPDDRLSQTDAGQLENDLFSAAYSSFAPTYDDTRAIISTQTRDMIWWQRLGKRKLNTMFGTRVASTANAQAKTTDAAPLDAPDFDEAKVFEGAVEEFKEGAMSESDISPVEVQTSELLAEINDLLRTLASYQRLRNVEASTQPRNPSSPSSTRAFAAGTPKEPSEEEIKSYRATKERLASIINSIPPYLVAKMNGKQLDDLRVSRNILVEAPSVPGVLEEDQATRKAKGTAAVAAAAAASATVNSRQSTTQSYGQFNRPSGLSNRTALTPQSYQSGNARAALSYARSGSGLAATPSAPSNRASQISYGSQTAPVNRTASTSQQYYPPRQSYTQQAASQGSPQPDASAQRHGSQQAQYQRPQSSASSAYNHNANTFGPIRSYNPSPHAPDSSTGQKWANANGRVGTPTNGDVAAAPSAAIGYTSPLKSVAQVAASPAAALPQAPPPAQMVPQTNGLSSR